MYMQLGSGLINKPMQIKSWKVTFLVFAILILLVAFLEIIILSPHLKYGFTSDDWWSLAEYRIFEPSSFGNLLSIWKRNGVYLTYQILYIGTLYHFFDLNFTAYQITNHVLRIVSILALFPLILVVFRNRMLAFITTILYAITYPPIGTLEMAIRGSDFIAITLMSIFLLVYSLIIKNVLKGGWWLLTSSILLFLTIFFSPIRTYPILAFILMVELYIFIGKRSKDVLLNSVKRMSLFYLPYLMLIFFSQTEITRFLLINLPEIFRRVTIGNWQLLLTPFASLGSTFITGQYWKLFGNIQFDSLGSYLSFLIGGPLIIYSLLIIFFSWLSSKKPWLFFIRTFILTFSLQILAFFIATHMQQIDSKVRMGYDQVEMYPVLFGLFLIALSYSLWREWRKRGKKDNLLLALWISQAFAFVFIVLTWALSDFVVIFKEIHNYLNIPSIGTSLFIGGTLILLYQKFRAVPLWGLEKGVALLTFLLIIPIFSMSKSVIDNYFTRNLINMEASEQKAIQDKIWQKLASTSNKQPVLIYFETIGDYDNGRFYEQSVLGRFSSWMIMRLPQNSEFCLIPQITNDKPDLLKDAIKTSGTCKGFVYINTCGTETFYDVNNFYAFKLKNREPIDIKERVLKEISFY